MRLSEDAYDLLRALDAQGLVQKSWPYGYSFMDFLETQPSANRSRFWRAAGEIEEAGLIERRLVGNEWCQAKGIHIREWNDYWYIKWTDVGLKTVQKLHETA